ncbi:restriction endonuclease subunit S [Vibrio alginolyticus]|uniref:restriction endonuclease subunit S n=1 Tax=Vibrio alginolyticus TaxID=663 RepID=UPI000DFE2182|nr:restriction endonuclease subunit S [Vibrio alginolyticus]SUP20845.1 Type I restriction-modification system, specificity subunit S [Vibrio alginolyticus]
MVRSQNVPNGWTVALLDSVAERCSGHTPSKSSPEYWNGGIKWISLADSFRLDNGYVYETDKEISQLGIDNSSAVIHPKGTVVLSRDAGVGKSAVMAEPMAVSQHFIAWKCDANKKVHNWFLYNWLQFHKPTFERQAVGSTIKTIGLPFFKKLKIALPSYDEQRKIAKILSTWDKAISTIEKLLETSKQQKKALMQQLLTGKKRLVNPETGKVFEGEWEEVLLGDISYITTGSSNREDSSLDSEYTFFDRSEDIRRSNRYLFDAEAVIVAGEGQDFVPKHFEGKFDLHQRTYAIMNFEKSVGKFLYYYIGYYRHYFLAQAVGSTVKSLRLPMFQKMPIHLPKVGEQQKIVSILNAADKEIEVLEAKLAHFKQEKKALMQQLLTGKRRVKVEEMEVA